MHSGNGRTRHLHLLVDDSVLWVCVKGARYSHCKTALHFISLFEAVTVTALSNLDLLSQTDHLAKLIASLLHLICRL